MKVTCDREKLLAAFQTAASVAPTRSPKPILQNARFEASGDDLALLSATDLEIGVRLEVSGVTVEAPGSVVLPIARVGAILRESTDETLNIETDGQGIVVRGKHSQFQLPAENPDEFPAVADFNEDSYHEVSARVLRQVLHRTVFATDIESTRYALGGVFMEMSAGTILGVGTDGRRMAKMEGPAESIGGHFTGEGGPIVPSRAVQLIDRALTDPEAEVRIAARANDILVKCGQATFYSRLVEGRFPKWRDVVPNRAKSTEIELVIGPLQAAVRQAAIVTNDESRGVDFTFGEGKLVLSGRAAEVGESRVETPIGYDGEPIAITLDPRYLLDFFKVLDPQKSFILSLGDAESAAICRTDDGYAYVIMPLARDR